MRRMREREKTENSQIKAFLISTQKKIEAWIEKRS